MEVFKKGNDIVMAFAGIKGIDDKTDLADAGLIYMGLVSEQLAQAAEAYIKLKKQYPDANITFTGHSHGGGLAAVMGVFFNEPAITFDQAPYSAILSDTVRSEVVYKPYEVLLNRLESDGYTHEELQVLVPSLLSYTPFDAAERSKLVTNTYLEGEALDWLDTSNPLANRIGTQEPIKTGSVGFIPKDLHSIDLLICFDINSDLRSLTYVMPQLVSTLTEKEKYGGDVTNPGLLRKLIRYQLGVSSNDPADEVNADNMLGRLVSDLYKMSHGGGISYSFEGMKLALMSFVAQKYYNEEVGRSGYGQELFREISGGGGLSFKISDIADSYSQIVGVDLYLTLDNWRLQSGLSEPEIQAIQEMLPSQKEWFIQNGPSVLEAVAGSDGAFMLGGTGADRLIGGSSSDLLLGNRGADFLQGDGGADRLYGGWGDDTLSGGTGDDVLDGGVGIDYLYGGDDADTLTGGTENDELYGESGNDELDGGDGADRLDGGADDDKLYGRDGNDTLYGGDNDDVLEGGADDDELYGGSGIDVLDGGKGTNRLEGGQGYDFYKVTSHDTISDEDGEGQVYLSGRYLSGGSRKEDDPPDRYKSADQSLIYELSGSTLSVTSNNRTTKLRNSLTIENFSNGDLGIFLKDEEEEDDETPSIEAAENKRSPIVLDLDGDGVETRSTEVYFDHDGDGLRELTGWAGADDGLLVFDRNGNGVIDNGTELFGNGTPLADSGVATDGFDALRDFDDNGDGRIDAQDAAYEQIQVWRDANGDALTDEGELLSLAEAGVAALNMTATAGSGVDAAGNDHRLSASYERVDGSIGLATDVWFDVDRARRVQGEIVDLSPEIMRLPNARGFGELSDLHQAMAKDPVLQELVTAFAAETDPQAQQAMMEALIYQWAGVTDVDPYSREPTRYYGHVMDARQLVTLEHLVGDDYLGTWCWGERDPNPHGQAAPLLIAEFQRFEQFVEAQLFAQSTYRDEMRFIKSHFDTGSGTTRADWADFQQRMDTLYEAGDVDSIRAVLDIVRSLGAYSPAFRTETDEAFAELAARYTVLVPIIDETALEGDDGDNRLIGNANAQLVVGGAGDDVLQGGAGDDTYFFQAGSGADQVYDSAGVDTIQFGEGVTPQDLQLRRDITTLWITRVDADSQPTGDEIRVDNFFDYDGTLLSPIEHVTFVDGTEWTLSDLLSKVVGEISTGDDHIYGTLQADTFDALSGDDTVYGFDGDDSLNGGDGNDVLDAGEGNDVLTGGSGNDELTGAHGSDTYVFGTGHGQDVIHNYDDSAGHEDVIVFEAGILPSDVNLLRDDDDLLLSTSDSDAVRVEKAFADDGESPYAIARVVFADGTVWNMDALRQMAVQGTESSQTLRGYASDDLIDAAGGDDVVYGNGGADTLNGDEGNDRLYGGAGDDSLAGGLGNDTLDAGTGNDELFGGEGDDALAGGDGIDTLLGGAGDDALAGGRGADTLDGGTGADWLDGGDGSDIYVFGRGYGQDTISSYDAASGKTDAIKFGSDVESADIALRRYGDDLVAAVVGSEDRLTVKDYFLNDALNPGYRLEELRFADGTVWDVAEVKRQVLIGTDSGETLQGYGVADVIDGLGGDDVLYGRGGDDTLSGSAGNDLINGEDGSDVLSGGAGSDQLYGGNGDDRLTGGTGEDSLSGGAGNDTYVFARGDGHDIIYAYDSTSGRQEVIEFAADITPTDILARRRGNDLVLESVDGNDRVTISSHFLNETANDSTIQEVRFADGTVWTLADLNDLVLHGSAAADVLEGHAADDAMTGAAGDDTLYGRAGDDVLDGGEGADTLYGETGNDTLIGGAGADRLEGGAGDDVYEIAAGEGQDTLLDTAGADRIRLTDLAPSEVLARREGLDLVLSRVSDGQVLARVEGEFSNVADVPGATAVETVEFSDGTTWDYAAIKLQALAGTESADRIEGHAEADLIQSLGGDDVVLAAAGDDEIHGGTGADELHGGAGADVLYGDGDDDTLYGGDDNDRLEGGLGADTLDGGAGDDVLLGGDGNDILQGSSGTDRLEGGEGDDTLQGNGELYGDAGADTLEGTGLLSGGAGDDALTGLGSDELLGGDGNDVLTANTNIWISGTGSVLEGGAGDDVLYGSFADDTYRFNVGDGNDRLIERRTGESYSNIAPSFDTLSFGAGVALADLAFERHGDDLLVRHANGADSITIERWFEEPTDHFKVNRFTFADGTELSDADVEARVVTYGTAEADTLLGYRALDEELYAGDGDDQVWGRDGDDALYGEAGADYLDGEAGADRLYGGAGADNLQGRDGNDVLDGGLDDDSLSGGAGDDVLLGQAGDDNLFGDGGADQLEGGAGDDYLTGGDGADVLLGGDGADQLGGDGGDDQLRGGLGDDKYVYASGQGADVVDNSDGGYDGVFFTDVGLDRLAFSRDGDDLLIAVDGDPAQSVRVLDHFLGGDAAIDYVQPNGGNMLDTQHIAHIVAANGLEGGYATAVVGSEGADSLSAYDSRDLVQGLGGDDTLWGMAGDDRIEGGAGNDALYGGNGSGQGSGTDELVGGDGDDVLNGEDGDDVLMGGAGNDDYYYGEGGGVDVIDNAGGGTDTVFFIGGIDRGRLSFHQDGDDLVMLLDGDLGQQVRVLGHFLGGEAAISYVQPTDGGYAIPAGDIAGMLTALPGDSSSGGSGDTGGTTPPDGGGDTGGDTDTDTPPTAQTGGADSLTGTAGNDVLLGGADNDTLDGNGGSDLLRGGVGDDTYVFGGGQAVLAEEDGADTLRFTNGITFNSVASGLMKSGDDLVLMVNGGPDQVTLQGFFRGGSELIETITFDTGGSLTADQIFGAFGLTVPDGSSPYAATVEGSNGDDALVQGGADAERLLGYNGADTLEGAGGDDLLIGGRGDDTYVFRGGDGQDVIDNTGGGYDTLQFADAGFSAVASGLMKSGNDLILSVNGGPDQVTLRGFFRGGDEAIDRLVFSDGSLLDKAQIFGAFGLGDPDPDGSPDYSGLPDERAYGTVQAARADGETLFGSSDADLIDGGAGNDVIDGGIGDDWLIGGRGDDVFLQGRDGGADTITAYDPTAGKTDTLRFGADIGIDQLWFERSGEDLSVSIIGTDDSATISGWYAGAAYHVERIETADGHVLLDAQVENLVSAMAAFAPPAAGETNMPASYQDDLQPVIAANWQ
ncbi:MAG: calcium-binding protein [Acidihalobacter sp.]|uniref:calcium-binding protein n=1 Tax=Acidihalobacter sp. TaxID=1872108 RepID=UPI00307CE247